MDDEKVKLQIGKNIAAYRKQAGLTQMGLAEKLNYSDKAISKWERGESIPDVLTLMQIASLFGITVNALLSDPESMPEIPERVVPKKKEKRRANHDVILALSSTLVWFVALLSFVILSTFDSLKPYSCLMFFYAIPANAIVSLSLRSAWRDFRWNRLLISIIVWGSLLSIYVTLRTLLDFRFWKLFLLGIPGQLAICLWFHMFRQPKKKEEETQNG